MFLQLTKQFADQQFSERAGKCFEINSPASVARVLCRRANSYCKTMTYTYVLHFGTSPKQHEGSSAIFFFLGGGG